MIRRWYDDPDILKAAYEKFGSLEAVSREIGGVHKSTLAQAWKKHGLGKLPRGSVPRAKNKDVLKKLEREIYG